MKPDVIITDEIASEADLKAVTYAINSGVTVIASAHGADHIEIMQKEGFCEAIKRGYLIVI